MNVPKWLDGVNELFPNQAKQVLERELVNRRGIRDLMEKPELLERIEPNMELVKTLLTHRDLMNEKTRVLARKIIDKVVKELKDKLRIQVEPAITGAIRRDKHPPGVCFATLISRPPSVATWSTTITTTSGCLSISFTSMPPSDANVPGTLSCRSIKAGPCWIRPSSLR